MKNVLYLHGLGSGANTTTASVLKNIMKNYNIVTVDLYHDIDMSMDIIYNAIEQNNIDIIIGTSLGGYFTLITKFSGIKIAINPVLKPSVDLVQFIGTHEYFVERQDGQKFYTLSQHDIDMYKGHYFSLTPNTYIILSDHDELLGNNIDKVQRLMKHIEIDTNEDHVFITNKIGHRLSNNFIKGDFKYILNDIINDVSNDSNVLFSPDLSTSDLVLESQELNEYQYLNLWTDNNDNYSHSNDIELKKKYCDEVWELLQKAYAHIGGSASFDDKDEMISKADLWKLKLRNGKISAAILYTTQKGGGRKLIAAGSRKSDNAIEAEQCKNDLVKMIKDDCVMTKRNAWAEVSGTMEYYFRKFGAAVIPVEKAKLILAKKSSQMVNIEDANGLDIANKQDIERIPNKKGEHYVRPIGGHMHRKVMLGNYNDDKALESFQYNNLKNKILKNIGESLQTIFKN